MSDFELKGDSMKVFENMFEDLEDMCDQFHISSDDLMGAVIHAAIYRYEAYDGSAYVLFEKEDKLYSVTACHCSCYGLEEQWKPEEETWENILH